MLPTPEVRTWQIFSTADGHYRWSLAGGVPDLVGGEHDRRSPEIPQTLTSRLPSMADLVLKASSSAPSKLLECDGGLPMFRTGSGRSVSVRESSIQKARSVLEEGDGICRGATAAIADGDEENEFPMFRTGSGKSVQLKQSSITKAAAVLGDDVEKGFAQFIKDGGRRDGSPVLHTGSGKPVTVRQSSVSRTTAVLEGDVSEKGVATFTKDGGSSDGFPMFRTGSGKSVTVRQSSVRRAAAVLEGDVSEKEFLQVPDCGSNKYDVPMFYTGPGKSVLVKPSSIKKAISVLKDGDCIATGVATFTKDGGSSDGFPMFRTGSGKSVTVRQSSVRRAAAVLEGDVSEKDKASKLIDDRHHTFSNSLFQTGSGKAVNISSSGLSRATTLLGLEENDKLSISKYVEHGINHFDANISTNWGTRWASVTYNDDPEDVQSVEKSSVAFPQDLYTRGNRSYRNVVQNLMGSEVCTSSVGQPPFKFSTAGGKSLSISSDALKRARSLLGGSEIGEVQNVAKADQPTCLIEDKKMFDEASSNKENISFAGLQRNVDVFDEASFNKENISFACFQRNVDMRSHQRKNLPPIPTSTNSLESSALSGTISKGVFSDQMKANYFHSDSHCNSRRNLSHLQDVNAAHAALEGCEEFPDYHHSVGPLADISNIHTENAHINGLGNEKKRLQRRSSISPFKRPRTSRFITPVNNNISILATDSMKTYAEKCCSRARVSTHYPFKVCRKTLREFFGGPPTGHILFNQLSDRVKHMNPGNAQTYRFCYTRGSDGIGVEDFQNMLIQSGALLSIATKEWVENHYKWIVWKLACLERSYPAKASGKFLTTFNVLEELRYRYEREVNYGHRSAVKRILDGDASSASMMVLCISSVYSCSGPNISKLNDSAEKVEEGKKLSSLDEAAINHATKIELTDGWYSLDAILDVMLTKQLAAGKLFVGQKLRVWGAGLCGWVGPISPLELIHINGTYRAHWSDPLGFCKNLGDPLAFRCVKGAGGKIPRTLVGVTRIYPTLYKERFPDGGSMVRSERMERKMLQLYNQRRSNVVEGIMGEQLDVSAIANDSEGAKIFKILEASAEPEVLMADMSSEQLMSFSTYQLKQEAIRQSSMHKKIDKALEDAGLSARDVTPFMRVRVVGLTMKGSRRRGPPREGLITIWNPIEKQKLDLAEGQIYSVFGLTPLNFGSDILYLQARGSSTVWTPMPSISEKFEPFFTPRKPVLLSNLGEVPLASEFDIAAVVVHVGEVYISGCQRKQWIFVTDGSKWSSELPSEEVYDCLLAVSFHSPINDNDTSGLLSQCLAETTVAFCNLVKRARDQMNHLWVAEATENSIYSVCYNLPKECHLKGAADSAKQWSKVSSLIIQKLRERVLCIVGDHGS